MAVERSLILQPYVVLMDIKMPIMDGVAAIRLLREQAPKIKTLVLTTFDDDEYVAQAMACGADGYLLKDTPSSELAQAIRPVNQGYTQMGSGLFAKAMATSSLEQYPANAKPILIPPELTLLTTREKEVLQLIATGHSNKEIAAQLYIAERTVKNHVNSILRSLNLRDREASLLGYPSSNRTQAAILANKYLA